MDLGLPGVWYALAGLMLLRMATLVWRYESKNGPFSKDGIPLDVNVLGSMDGMDGIDVADGTSAEETLSAASNILLVEPTLVDKRKTIRSPADVDKPVSSSSSSSVIDDG